jgi:UDP-GlcNAc:undecaprenyl-phosphate/decaprenyl-phosphate GlcNAc-1-phosphate transferase
VLDTLVVMGRRMLQGKSPFSPDRTHLHHRLLALGLPYDQTVMLLYVGMMLFGCLALVVQSLPEWQQLASALITAFILFAGLFIFERTQPRIYGLRQAQLLQTITTYAKNHSGWLQRNTRPCALTALTFVGIAAMLAPTPHKHSIAMLYIVLVSVVLLYPWHPDREHAAVQKGIVYLMLAALFLSLQTSAPSWLHDYLAVLAAVALGIVLVRATSWDSDTHGSSSFQVLVLLSMAIIPIVLLPMHNSDGVEHVVLACLESVPVAWLLNGYSVHIYQRNRRVTLVLMGLIVLALLKSEIHHAGILSKLLS